MILARIKTDDNVDWFGEECEFPILPPIGSTIEVIDRNANEQSLRVTDIIVEGVKPSTKAELPNLFAKQTITLICSVL